MSRWNRRDRRSLKRTTDAGNRTLATMPWKTAATFDQLESILDVMEKTGNVDDERSTVVFQVPSSREWFSLAPAINGLAEVFELHAHIADRDMPTAPLRQLANKFKYGMMVFQSDLDLVRESLQLLKAESKGMTLNYATALIQTTVETA